MTQAIDGVLATNLASKLTLALHVLVLRAVAGARKDDELSGGQLAG